VRGGLGGPWVIHPYMLDFYPEKEKKIEKVPMKGNKKENAELTRLCG
jgi:hypothetical protein